MEQEFELYITLHTELDPLHDVQQRSFHLTLRTSLSTFMYNHLFLYASVVYPHMQPKFKALTPSLCQNHRSILYSPAAIGRSPISYSFSSGLDGIEPRSCASEATSDSFLCRFNASYRRR